MTIRRKLSRAITIILTLPLLLSLAVEAPAKTKCNPTPRGQLCVSEVDFGSFAQQAYQNQYQSQWCWAACISMLYRYYKHPVSQQRIVSEVYGGPVNMPAGAGIVLARQLNRRWRDDSGKDFKSELTAAYDFDARVFAINNNWIINELDQDRPFIIGAGSHAVVGTAIQYFVTPAGPYVTSIGVFDPWPGIGARGLNPAEMMPMHMGGSLRFVATVKVTD
jgi:hypothetical protein